MIQDRTVIQYQQMLALPQATPRNRQSVKNWIEGNKPLVRSESICFLENSGDNDFVAPRGDTGDEGLLEALIEVLGSHVPGLMKYVRERQRIKFCRTRILQSNRYLNAMYDHESQEDRICADRQRDENKRPKRPADTTTIYTEHCSVEFSIDSPSMVDCADCATLQRNPPSSKDHNMLGLHLSHFFLCGLADTGQQI